MRIMRHKKGWRLHAEQWLPLPPEQLWAFFADAHNLDAITPAFLRFEVLTPGPIEMRTGTLIDYRLRLHGVPVRWRTEITAWEPPTRFVDEQIRGPYKRWRHEHVLEPRAGGTNYIDDVYYQLRGGTVAGLINRAIVQRDVTNIFAYRRERLDDLYSGDGGAEPLPRQSQPEASR